MNSHPSLKQIVVGVFLVTFASLLSELTLTRLFSVLLWYHFAFLAISLALTGISAGAVVASLFPRMSEPASIGRNISRHALAGCGVLSITRWLWTPERETVRIVALARSELAAIGVTDPARHIVVVGHAKQGCVMVTKSALTDSQIAALAARVDQLKFDPLYIPLHPAANPIGELATTPDPIAMEKAYAFNISPPDDNRPFFFFTMRLRDLPHLLSIPEGRAQNIGL